MKFFLCFAAALLLATPGCSKDKSGRAPTPASKTVEPATTPPAPTKTAGTNTPTVDPGATPPQSVSRAIAVLAPTKGNHAHGVVRFRQSDDGVDINAEVEGLPPGKHAYHIHLLGDCSAPDGTSAGTHFNSQGSSTKPPANIKRITGNLGDLDADANGKATAVGNLPKASLVGPYSIIGRSVVIHEKPNDPTKPPIGGAGSRIACGVIGIAQ